MKRTLTTVAGLLLAGGIGTLPHAEAETLVAFSSHNDAPLIKQDPQANLTDVYAFVGTKYNDPSTEVLNIVVNVRPFSEPGDGPHFERFAPDALYSIHVADPMTGEGILRYDFEFSSVDSGIRTPIRSSPTDSGPRSDRF